MGGEGRLIWEPIRSNHSRDFGASDIVETSEIAERIESHRLRAAQYFQNSQEAVGKEEYEKAGELIWGAVANYIHAFILLRERKIYKRHRAVVDFGRNIAIQRGDERLLNAVEEADEMHEHYYRGSRIRSSFPDRFEDGRYAIETLDKLLRTEVGAWMKARPTKGNSFPNEGNPPKK